MKNILIIDNGKDDYLHMLYNGGSACAILDKRAMSLGQIEQAITPNPISVDDMDFYTLRDGAIDAVLSKLQALARYGR